MEILHKVFYRDERNDLLEMYIYRVTGTKPNDTLYYCGFYTNYYCTRFLKYSKFLTGGCIENNTRGFFE